MSHIYFLVFEHQGPGPLIFLQRRQRWYFNLVYLNLSLGVTFREKNLYIQLLSLPLTSSVTGVREALLTKTPILLILVPETSLTLSFEH